MQSIKNAANKVTVLRSPSTQELHDELLTSICFLHEKFLS